MLGVIWNFSKSSHTTEISAPKNPTVNRNNETRKLLKKESIVEEVQKTKENQQKQLLNSDKDKFESVIVSNEKYKKTRTTESKVGENSKNKNIQKSKKAIFQMEDGQAYQSAFTVCFRLRIYQMMTAIPIMPRMT